MNKFALFTGLAALFIASCNSGNNDEAEITQLREEAIAIHDEIMPKISQFDRSTVRIDSILANLDQLKTANEDLDTTEIRAELAGIKSNLERATDSMMEWMMEFDVDPQDISAAEIKSYYQDEIEKVKKMKRLFEDVTKESTDKLSRY